MVIVRAVVARADVVYPNLETESAFLRSYTLPIESLPGISLAAGLSGPDAAGRGCAFHQREFQTWFAITSGNQLDFMAAVQRDLESRLSAERSQMISENGSPSEGFQFQYVAAKTQGSVIVDPLVIDDPASATFKAGLDSGRIAVKLRIRISETWHKESGADCKKL